MPQENDENIVEAAENTGEEIVDPSEQDAAAADAASTQQGDQSLGEPDTDEGDGPNRWGDGPNR